MNAIDLLERTETTLVLSSKTLNRMLKSCRKASLAIDFELIFAKWIQATPLVKLIEIDTVLDKTLLKIVTDVAVMFNLKIKMLK